MICALYGGLLRRITTKVFCLCLRFDPERFSNANSKTRNPRAFEPFGFGLRKCHAWRLVHVHAILALTAILPKFRFNLVEGQEVIIDYGFLAKPRDEIWLTVVEEK